MNIDFFGAVLGSPFAARILEIAHQFLLFRIDRDDRLAVCQKHCGLFVDVFKLRIPIHMLVAFAGLAVGLQAIAQLAQAIPNHRMADLVTPCSFSSSRSLRRLSDVHNSRRIGSPRVTGSTSALSSARRVGSSTILDLRPPPCRRIRSFPTEGRLRDLQDLDISSVAPDPSPQPRRSHPHVQSLRASDAAQRRRLRSSSRGAIDFQRFRRVLMSEAPNHATILPPPIPFRESHEL